MTRLLARDTSARPRLATSSRIAVRSVSPPSARAISTVASSAGDRLLQLGALALLGVGVAPGMVDRDAGELGQHDDRFLVLLAEPLGALLVGQVEVAERLAADQDRHAQERASSADGRPGIRRSEDGCRRRRGAAARG